MVVLLNWLLAVTALGFGGWLAVTELKRRRIQASENLVLFQVLMPKDIPSAADPQDEQRKDFREQIGLVNRMGSMEQLLGMLPGGQRLKELADGGLPEKEIKRVVAMIDSMTPRERRDHTVINGSRKKRIARGSGTSVQDVNRLIKQFLTARKMMKALTAGGGGRQLAQALRSF